MRIQSFLWFAVILALTACSSEDPVAPHKAVADAGSADTADVAALTCAAKLAGCFGKDRYVCNEAGTAFEKQACPTDQICHDGLCVECIGEGECKPGQKCLEGACKTTPLTVTTKELAAGLVGQPYAATLEAAGGTLPLQWSLAQGTLPAGLLLDGAGKFVGSPTAPGTASFQVQVKDAMAVTATAILSLEVKDSGIVVTTAALKSVLEGQPMAPVPFAAQGGATPYFFGIGSGALPKGVSLSSDGILTGTPTEDGDFPFDLKVFDNGQPTLSGKKAFTLTVKLAPLEVVGAQEVNLIITKIIVLPLIIVVDKVPVPYNTKLQAIGGKKPYHWLEEPLPGFVASFIPKSGLPKGLTLADDGTVSGSVTDASLVVEVKVPLTQIALKGFFFAANVSDSQSPAQKKVALYIIPTVPVGP